MKKLVNNAIAAVMVFAAAMMNTVDTFAANGNDTLDNGILENEISPDGEEELDETTVAVESWMFETIYTANEESNNVEDWMFENMFTENEENLNVVESWMFEDIYTAAEEVNEVEGWMFDNIYTTSEEEVNQIEDWMFETIYTPEAEPEVEAWMFE
ncbi:MAG: hypothetical protein MJZ61_05085 [Bacteroidales bacterium]|nr:hypothetical protein [Bacteroidales bacterium]